MKVLYCTSVFLDYRIPFFKRLVKLFNGEFYVMYSPKRYQLIHREDLVEKIHQELGENAIAFKGDHLFCTKEMSFKRMSYEHGKKIPITRGLIKAVGKVKPDVLITEGFFQWTPLVTLYATVRRIPVYIAYERTPWTERNSTFLHKWHRKFTDIFMTGYLVNGSETKKYLESLNIKREKIHITGMSADSAGLANAIRDLDHGADYKLLKELKEKKEKVIVYSCSLRPLIYLFIGQIVERKGIKFLLNAWEKHIKVYPNDILLLVGKGDLLENFQKLYADEKSIVFTGRVSYSNIYKYYAAADVFINPTIEDNWSLVIPEAMACGLPVTTSIYNGCHVELIKEGVNGFIFDTFKEETIVTALGHFHGRDLQAMGKASVEIEREFDTEHCAQREFDAIMKK